jgi:hypothetical protein
MGSALLKKVVHSAPSMACAHCCTRSAVAALPGAPCRASHSSFSRCSHVASSPKACVIHGDPHSRKLVAISRRPQRTKVVVSASFPASDADLTTRDPAIPRAPSELHPPAEPNGAHSATSNLCTGAIESVACATRASQPRQHSALETPAPSPGSKATVHRTVHVVVQPAAADSGASASTTILPLLPPDAAHVHRRCRHRLTRCRRSRSFEDRKLPAQTPLHRSHLTHFCCRRQLR